MFLDYFALVILLAGLALVFYTFIFIHDLPYKIAKKRQHPHVEAIHVACWLSLFTLHAIWPIVYIWSVTHLPPAEGVIPSAGRPADVNTRLARLEHRLRILGILDTDSNEPQSNAEAQS